MKRFIAVLALLLLTAVTTITLAAPPAAQKPAKPAAAAAPPPATSAAMMVMNQKDLKWENIIPEWGVRSPRAAILRVDPKTKATQLLIWAPKGIHVPRHWHSANESITIIRGTFSLECEGQRMELNQGGWGYINAKKAHQAWTGPREDVLSYVMTDGAWDVNWVDGPPGAQSPTGK